MARKKEESIGLMPMREILKMISRNRTESLKRLTNKQRTGSDPYRPGKVRAFIHKSLQKD